MATDNRKLVEASMALRGASPEHWLAFGTALREYAAATTLEIVRVAPDMLVRAQGMAIMAQEIATIVNDAPRLYDTYNATLINRRNIEKQNVR